MAGGNERSARSGARPDACASRCRTVAPGTIGEKGVEQASKLPTREEAIGQLVGLILSPAANLAGALLGPAGTLAGIVKAIEATAKDAPEPAAAVAEAPAVEAPVAAAAEPAPPAADAPASA